MVHDTFEFNFCVFVCVTVCVCVCVCVYVHVVFIIAMPLYLHSLYNDFFCLLFSLVCFNQTLYITYIIMLSQHNMSCIIHCT